MCVFSSSYNLRTERKVPFVQFISLCHFSKLCLILFNVFLVCLNVIFLWNFCMYVFSVYVSVPAFTCFVAESLN